ncbi:DUF1841 family protein [Aquisalimonas sp. 2447]|uniref:DUF1841 family protein n=1 Tax=Aquisalimonas sp. 2447 TaxID=2740807 RepID=UPI0014324C69|nr:DUF1841 family protein [Aquisalimonas sp. 2447]QIT54721.1 DUF1841 family protein [Aquisalimonas sp. 2447]
MFSNDRATLRRQYLDAWRKYRDGEPCTPLETMIGTVVAEHPEYHALLEDPDQAVDADWQPEGGATNPFLHMGLHLALREQVAGDRPAGIRAVHERLTRKLGDHLDAEHRMMEPLAEAMWNAQRSGGMPDEQAYLAALRGLVPRTT